jgi:hypothetical protein
MPWGQSAQTGRPVDLMHAGYVERTGIELVQVPGN